MSQALEAAWRKAPESLEALGRQRRASSVEAVNASWLSAPAAVALSQRNGGLSAADGRETELELALPVWRPGQRAASRQASDAESSVLQAQERRARWQLLGELREAMAAVQLAQIELQEAELRAHGLRQLADDVARRVRAGDLAPADELASRAQWLEAHGRVQAAIQGLAARRSAWSLLTGLEQLPVDEVFAAPSRSVPDTHPELVHSAAEVEFAYRRIRQLQTVRSGAPEVNLGVRHESAGTGSGRGQRSVVIGLRVPVGGEVHRQPEIEQALAELDLVRARQHRLRERLASDLLLAEQQLQVGQMRQQAETERTALLEQRAGHIDRAFRAGESALTEVLQSQALAAESRVALARQRVELHLARVRLEHLTGVLP